jgi:hypothetical protein
MVFNDSFLLRGLIGEAGRPSLKCFEAERERVLSWHEGAALIQHCFVFCEHVSCFEILHSEVAVVGSVDEFWTMIITSVVF